MFERSIQIVAKRLAEEVKAGKNHALYRLDNSSNQGAEIAKVTLASNNLPNILLLQKKVVTLHEKLNMRIFTEQTLKEYISKNPKSKVALQEWTTIVKKSKWECFADVKATFNLSNNEK